MQERSLLWEPTNALMGDATIIAVGDAYHLFAEMFETSDRQILPGRIVGHAVSRDMIHWDMLPPCIRQGEPGAFDAFTIFHMDVFIHDDTWYMHYTGLDIRGEGQQQTVGLATSRDGITWEKHPRNPVCTADPRYYEARIPREATYQEKDFGRLWFRDPCIIRDDTTGRFGMAVIARDKSKHPDESGCIAWAESDDLVHWQTHPPIFSPGRFHTIETPSIFEHEGRHYLVYMTHPAWGTPPITTDPYQNAGDLYAISNDGWKGPWRTPEDELIIGSMHNIRFGAQRIMRAADGSHWLYGWLSAKPDPHDVDLGWYPKYLPPLKPVTFTSAGLIHVGYNAAIENYSTPLRDADAPLYVTPCDAAQSWRTEGNSVSAKNYASRQIALLPEAPDSFIIEAVVDLQHGYRAGFVARTSDEVAEGWYAVADRQAGRVEFGLLQHPTMIDARAVDVPRQFTLRLVGMGKSIELYLNDRLLLHQLRHRETAGRLGLVIEKADATFSRVSVKELHM